MTDEIASLRPLDRGFLSVLRLRAAGSAAVLLFAAGVAELILADRPWPSGIAIGVALLYAVWAVGIAPARRFRWWGHAFTGDELHVARGWWVRTHTIVPVARVQHIDLSQGPAERRFGIATLVLHTAGTEHSRVDLPGLRREDAESIRDTIRTRIEAAPW